MWPGPRDDLAPDVIGSGGEDSGMFARWLGFLVRLVPQAGSPWQRRLAGALVAGAVLAGGIAAAVVLVPSSGPARPARSAAGAAGADHAASREHAISVTITQAITSNLAPGGVFASGSADGRPWHLAVQDIADPGARCQPAVTLNGTDADPIFADPPRLTPVGNPAFTTLGPAMPGVGFAFVQVPANADWVWLERGGTGQVDLGMNPITISSCGQRFHLIGFAYPLVGALRIHVNSHTLDTAYTVPSTLSAPQPSLSDPQVDGVWQDMDAARAQVASATLATGTAFGQRWSIRVTFGTAGDCYTLSTDYIDDSANARPEQTSLCGPVSTPQGPDTIMALALGSPASHGQGVGYAVSVGPVTARLTPQLSDGTFGSVTPVVVDGRRYAAFFVPGPAHLTWLNWDNAAGKQIAGIQGLSPYGYTQFQP